MIYNIIDKLKWSYRKNYADVRALIRREYPYFVYQNNPVFLNEKVPVFTFHSVHPIRFEEQLKFLKENGYHTLNTTEFYEFLTGGRLKEKSVLLTFDDGTASLWGVAFPLLKKYDYRAASFIIPGCISNSKKIHPNLEDVWSGNAEMNEILKRETSPESLCFWHEIQAMHKSGVIDFQSHTMYHHLVCVSSKLVDFIHPGFNYYFFGNITVPVFQDKGEDVYERNLDWGTPIYESEPRMSIKPRYFDNDFLRKQCVEFVEINGGKQFFQSKNWRKILRTEHDRLLDSMTGNGRFETKKEQEANLFNDLHNSKKIIEEILCFWAQIKALEVALLIISSLILESNPSVAA